MLRVGIIGAAGRMGRAIIRAIAAESDLELSCAMDVSHAGEDAFQVAGVETDKRLPIDSAVGEFLRKKPDVALDFSVGDAVAKQGPDVVAAKVPYIVGATGTPESGLDALRAAADREGVPVLIVPNFSIGANLMIRFSETAAKYLASVEIIERHHEKKADAPSGTAIYTAHRIHEANPHTRDYRSSKEAVERVRGGTFDGVRIHSVRSPGVLADQSVVFSEVGETLTIEHRAISRDCYMPGILYAVRNIGRHTGFIVGLDKIMEV
jgi:4-hydroxy-tetrahydrodipicolinate reductase